MTPSESRPQGGPFGTTSPADYEAAIGRAEADGDASSLARELRERMRVNVGLVAENAVLRRERGRDRTSVLASPWDRPDLNGWTIIGMNHYFVGEERHLYVAMTDREVERCIKAHGPDEAAVFDALADAAKRAAR